MKYEQKNSIKKENLLWNEEKCQDKGLQRGNFYAYTPACLSDFFVDKYSKKGDLVVDLFAGRGTTGISAMEQGRRAVVNDLNPLTCLFAQAKRVVASQADFVEVLHDGLDPKKYTDSFHSLNFFEMPSFIQPQTDIALINLAEHLNTFRDGDEEIKKAILWARYLLTEIVLGKGDSFYFTSRRILAQRKTYLKRNCSKENAPQFLFEKMLQSFKYYQPFMQAKEKELICQKEGAAFWSNPCKQEVQLFLTVPPELITQVYVSNNALKLWLSGYSNEEFKKTLPLLDNLDTWTLYMGRVLGQQRKFLSQQGDNIWLLSDGDNTQKTLQPALLAQAELNGYHLVKKYNISIDTKANKISSKMKIIAFIFKQKAEIL
ncbi:MAG: site-specific DNA-methyltransferase [Firmicutes bacterium]|nr:site-specific DNA-methyltransferase [Bacillota bacterium]